MTAAAGLLAHRTFGDGVRVGDGDGGAGDGGETVLLLNGGFMSIAAWEPIAAPLAARYRVVGCDFRGQLLTPGPAHPDLAGNAGDVVALLDHLGLARVHVVGTSFGGMVGLILAARHPRRVASLAAVTVADRATAAMRAAGEPFRRVVAGILGGGDRRRFHAALVDEVYSADYAAANRELLTARGRQIAELPDAWFAGAAELLAAVESFDLRRDLAAVRCPTLVVVAGDDRVLPPERGRAVAAAIPGARLAEHPASGHALVAEHPGWLVERLLAFLAEVTRP